MRYCKNGTAEVDATRDMAAARPGYEELHLGTSDAKPVCTLDFHRPDTAGLRRNIRLPDWRGAIGRRPKNTRDRTPRGERLFAGAYDRGQGDGVCARRRLH